jgi:hypothetical protein
MGKQRTGGSTSPSLVPFELSKRETHTTCWRETMTRHRRCLLYADGIWIAESGSRTVQDHIELFSSIHAEENLPTKRKIRLQMMLSSERWMVVFQKKPPIKKSPIIELKAFAWISIPSVFYSFAFTTRLGITAFPIGASILFRHALQSGCHV